MIKPLFNNVLVELIKEDAVLLKGPAGDVIRTQSKEAEQYCRVISIGEQVTNVSPNDYVLLKNSKPYEAFEVDGKLIAFIQNYEIAAVIDEETIKQFKATKARRLNAATSNKLEG